MKSTTLLQVLAIATLACSAACNERDEFLVKTDDPNIVIDAEYIGINATIVPRTDRIGVGLPSEWNGNIGVLMSYEGDFKAAPYLLKDGTVNPELHSAVFTGDIKWCANSMQHRLYAYYPQREGDASTTVHISLPKEQAQDGTSIAHLVPSDFRIAQPSIPTSPNDVTNAEKNKAVPMKFQSTFSIIELRLAHYEGVDHPQNEKIQLTPTRVTVTSNNRYLAVDNGTIDITRSAFARDFGRVDFDGAEPSRSITVSLANAGTLPKFDAAWRGATYIPNISAVQPVDLTKAFPVRFWALSNYVTPLIDATVGLEKWTLEVSCARTDEAGGALPDTTFVQEMNVTFSSKPNATVALNYALATRVDTIATGGGDHSAPGIPWDGETYKMPDIDMVGKKVVINDATEMGWFAAVVNHALPLHAEAPPQGLSRNFRDYTVYLNANIDLGGELNGVEWSPIGTGGGSRQGDATSDTAMSAFAGTFDGQGYRITGLRITDETKCQTLSSGNDYYYVYAGLFGWSYAKEIRNLIVEGYIDLDLTSYSHLTHIGGIVGHVADTSGVASFKNCSYEGLLRVAFGDWIGQVGGIVGRADYAKFSRCYSAAKMEVSNQKRLSSQGCVGGIVAELHGGYVRECYFDGTGDFASNNINKGSLTATGHWQAGGIVGYGSGNFPIEGCKNSASINVSGMVTTVGGIIGESFRPSIRSCSNSGTINVPRGVGYNDASAAGGIVGAMSNNKLVGCYNSGSVEAPNIASRSGNIAGLFDVLFGLDIFFAWDFEANVRNNYYSAKTLRNDVNGKLKPNSITKLGSGGAYPDDSLEGWTIKSSGGYWADGFDGSDPQLAWELEATPFRPEN